MLTYGLKDKDKEQLEYPLTFYSGFGKDPNDYIHLYVYDLEDNLLADEMFPTSEIIFNDKTLAPTSNIILFLYHVSG